MHVPDNRLSPVSRMSPAKRALLEMRLRGQVPVRTKTQAIPRRPEGAGTPLSFAQQRLWFLHQMAPRSAVYNVPAALRLEGVLNLSALEQAFTEIVRRHEALRTTFEVVEGEPVQLISPPYQVTLPIVDLEAFGKTEQEARVRQLADEEARRPFDLERGALVRIRLLRLGEKEHALLATLHHIVSDGWSMGILVREMAELYDAFCSKRPTQLPELPIQYADFAHWQRNWLQGERLDEHLSYWRQQLADLPALNFPTDYPRPAGPRFRGACIPLTLQEDLTARLNELRKRAGVTLFTSLLAAFQMLLQRYTGQTDIVMGTVIANRNRTDIEGLIGFFVNALVLRTSLQGNPTFYELLARTREVVEQAYAHQDMPFDKLAQELRIGRGTATNPFFQISLTLHNVPRRPFDFQGLKITPLEMEKVTSEFDLSVHLMEDAGGLQGSVVYNTDLFAKSTITRLATHYEMLLAAIVRNPTSRLAELPLLTPPERVQLLDTWQGKRAPYRSDSCIHEVFELQVERIPEALAVVFEDQQVTYQSLNARATNSRIICGTWAWGPKSLWRYALNAHWIWFWAFWLFSRPGERICLSIQPIPRNA